MKFFKKKSHEEKLVDALQVIVDHSATFGDIAYYRNKILFCSILDWSWQCRSCGLRDSGSFYDFLFKPCVNRKNHKQ